MPHIQVLLIEDSDTDAMVIRAHLRSSGLFDVIHVKTLAEAQKCLRNNGVCAVILDLNLPDSAGMTTFSSLHSEFPDKPIVILSGQDDEQLAVEAVAKGAQDYVPKGTVEGKLLVRSLQYAIERQGRMLAERRNLLIEGDLDMARRIQQRMLPSQPPYIPGFEIAAVCQPTEACGGDFFDFIKLDNGQWDLVVADVSSHGFGPALIMVGARRTLRTCARIYDDIGKLLTFANRAVVEDTLGEHFVTLFYARLDPTTRTLTYSAAGHPVWVITAGGEVKHPDCDGFPMGLWSDIKYDTLGTITLDMGDILLLPTDGSYEAIAADGEAFGQPRIFDLIINNRSKSAAEIRDLLLAEIDNHCHPASPHDDVTLVLLKVTH